MFKKTKKIGLVCLNSSIGMILLLESFSNYLKKYFDIFVLCDKAFSPKEQDEKIYKISYSPSHFMMALHTINPFIWYKIFKILKKEDPICLYIIATHSLNPVIILIVKIVNMNIKIISHIHDVVAHKETKNELLINVFQRMQIINSEYFTVFGTILKKTFTQKFNITSKNVLPIYHGVSREQEMEIDVDYRRHTVSFVGRIDKYKDIGSFLRVAKIFSIRNPKVMFILAGEGDLSSYRSLIESIPNLIIKNRLLTNEEIDNILQNSVVALLPYVDASQSGIVPVAYFNGCPVIVTNVGGLPEFVEEGETGYIVPPRDISAMVNKIKYLLANNNECKRLRRNCLKYYKNNLRYEKILKEVAEFITNKVNK